MEKECFKNIDEICDALDEDLDSEVCREIKNHLDACPRCCAQVDSLRKTVHLYQHAENVQVPSTVDNRLWKILNLQKPS